MRFAFAAALILLAACAPIAQSEPAAPVLPAPTQGYPLIEQAAPHFSAPLVSGGILSDETLKGHWTIVEFWGLWCEDSLADLTHTQALASAVRQDPSLRFVTVHVDQRYGKWKSAADFAADEQIKFPIALDPDQSVKRAFQVKATPTYLVIDPNGVIRAARGDLRKDQSSEGGVKSFIKQIAELKRNNP